MRKTILLVVLFVVTGFLVTKQANASVDFCWGSNPSCDWDFPIITPTDTPEVSPSDVPTDTPELSPTDTPTATPEATTAPSTSSGGDGRSDGLSSCPSCTQAPKVLPAAPPATGRG